MKSKELLKYLFLVVLFCIIQHAFSQNSINKQYQNWTQYFINIRFAERWSANADTWYRWKDISGQKFQTGVRGSFTYHFKQPVTLTVGYAYFLHFPIDNGATITRHEHRPWQQLSINSKLGRLQMMHRYRFEQRWIEKASNTALLGGYAFNFRGRYQLNLQYPLNKKEITQGTLYAIAFNEIFVNFGKEIVYNYFDQNRIGFGLGFQITKSFAATLVYQYIWQQRTKGNTYNSIDCARLAFIHNLDLRKKDNTSIPKPDKE